MKKKTIAITAVILVLGMIGISIMFKEPENSIIPKNYSADSLTDEQVELLREEYPIIYPRGTGDCAQYSTIKEFSKHIPLFVLCTVEKKLDDYTVNIGQPLDDGTSLHFSVDFEQYQLRVDETLIGDTTFDNSSIIVAMRKGSTDQNIPMSKGEQFILPLDAMQGPHAGKYMIAYDVAYYKVNDYLLAVYETDYDLNGLRLDNAREKIKQQLHNETNEN